MYAVQHVYLVYNAQSLHKQTAHRINMTTLNDTAWWRRRTHCQKWQP